MASREASWVFDKHAIITQPISLTDLINLFVCNQGIGNVAKETEDEVKRHGVKGVKSSKDNGIEGSFVSFRQACHYYSTDHLLLTCWIISLRNQGIGNVAKETEDEVKRHGVKGVKASKDDGVEESFVSAESMSLLINQSTLTDFLNPFLCNQGIGNVAKETED